MRNTIYCVTMPNPINEEPKKKDYTDSSHFPVLMKEIGKEKAFTIEEMLYDVWFVVENNALSVMIKLAGGMQITLAEHRELYDNDFNAKFMIKQKTKYDGKDWSDRFFHVLERISIFQLADGLEELWIHMKSNPDTHDLLSMILEEMIKRGEVDTIERIAKRDTKLQEIVKQNLCSWDTTPLHIAVCRWNGYETYFEKRDVVKIAQQICQIFLHCGADPTKLDAYEESVYTTAVGVSSLFGKGIPECASLFHPLATA